MPKKRS